MKDKKKILLRQGDVDVMSLRARREDGSASLIITMKIAPELEALLAAEARSSQPEGAQLLDEWPCGLSTHRLHRSAKINAIATSQDGTFVGLNPATLIERDGVFSYSAMCIQGVSKGDGIEFALEGAVSPEILRRWVINTRSIAAEIWKIYMYPIDLEASLTTRELVV